MEESLKSLKNLYRVIVGLCAIVLLVAIEQSENKELQEVKAELQSLSKMMEAARNSANIETFLGVENVEKGKAAFAQLVRENATFPPHIYKEDSLLKVDISKFRFSFPKIQGKTRVLDVINALYPRPEVHVAIPDIREFTKALGEKIPKNDRYYLISLDFADETTLFHKFQVQQDKYNYKAGVVPLDYRGANLKAFDRIRQKRLSEGKRSRYDSNPFAGIMPEVYFEGSVDIVSVPFKYLIDSTASDRFNFNSWLMQEQFQTASQDRFLMKGESWEQSTSQFDTLLPAYMYHREHLFYPGIREYLYLVGEETPLSAIRTVEQEIQKNKQNISLLGFSISYEYALIASPLLILIFMIYFRSHILHISQDLDLDSPELKSFPLILLYNDTWSRIFNWITILLLPAFSCAWLIKKYWNQQNILAISIAILLTLLILFFSWESQKCILKLKSHLERGKTKKWFLPN